MRPGSDPTMRLSGEGARSAGVRYWLRRALAALGCGILVCTVLLSVARADPLTGATGSSSPPEGEARLVPHVFQQVGAAFVGLQRDINRALARQLAAVKQGTSYLPLLVGMLIGFGYGAFRAAGPAMARQSWFPTSCRAMHGSCATFWMGGQIAILHVLSAIIIVSALHFVLERTLSTPVD